MFSYIYILIYIYIYIYIYVVGARRVPAGRAVKVAGSSDAHRVAEPLNPRP